MFIFASKVILLNLFHHCILVGSAEQTICEYLDVVSAVFHFQEIENGSIYYVINLLCFQRFAAVIMRIREPKTTALIFASGKMVCSIRLLMGLVLASIGIVADQVVD